MHVWQHARAKLANAWSRNARRRLLQHSAHRALRAFATRHPQAEAQLFDDHFVRCRALPILAGCLPNRMAKAEALTAAWLEQWGFNEAAKRRFAGELMPVTLDFVALFEWEVRRAPHSSHGRASLGGEDC